MKCQSFAVRNKDIGALVQLSEMVKSMQTLRAINGILHLDDTVGNCRGLKRKGMDAEPLRKRKRNEKPLFD